MPCFRLSNLRVHYFCDWYFAYVRFKRHTFRDVLISQPNFTGNLYLRHNHTASLFSWSHYTSALLLRHNSTGALVSWPYFTGALFPWISLTGAVSTRTHLNSSQVSFVIVDSKTLLYSRYFWSFTWALIVGHQPIVWALANWIKVFQYIIDKIETLFWRHCISTMPILFHFARYSPTSHPGLPGHCGIFSISRLKWNLLWRSATTP